MHIANQSVRLISSSLLKICLTAYVLIAEDQLDRRLKRTVSLLAGKLIMYTFARDSRKLVAWEGEEAKTRRIQHTGELWCDLTFYQSSYYRSVGSDWESLFVESVKRLLHLCLTSAYFMGNCASHPHTLWGMVLHIRKLYGEWWHSLTLGYTKKDIKLVLHLSNIGSSLCSAEQMCLSNIELVLPLRL